MNNCTPICGGSRDPLQRSDPLPREIRERPSRTPHHPLSSLSSSFPLHQNPQISRMPEEDIEAIFSFSLDHFSSEDFLREVVNDDPPLGEKCKRIWDLMPNCRMPSPTHEFSNIATATSEFSLNKKDHNIKRAPALYPTVALSMQDKIAFA
ncbi:hypothetical protein MRB53_001619 [Persea americana]|uniref:Uncharacterized protein n=1 Tax=Persea americana TaxID=3435 RepID=A0ACC2MS88_PERAE|nr:hypothetical protein MRB53_001619 [Persea americana]